MFTDLFFIIGGLTQALKALKHVKHDLTAAGSTYLQMVLHDQHRNRKFRPSLCDAEGKQHDVESVGVEIWVKQGVMAVLKGVILKRKRQAFD